MSLRLPAYPDYKDSGVEWLGPIPSHWKTHRTKNVFRPIDVRSQTGAEELLTVSAKDGVVPRRTKTVTMFMAASYVGYKLCWPGDLVINSLWAWANGLGFSQHHGIVSSAYGVYRLLPQYNAHYAYFNYLLRSRAYDWEFNVRSKGIWISRLQLTDDEFFKMPIVLPPADEQAAIVRFLDALDRRVTRLLRDKRRLIALLNEQKQAVIHHAVTKGLNPAAPMKPSGVEWLGDIPAHWGVWQVHFFAKVGNGSTPSRANQSYWTGGTYPWLNSSTVNQDYILESNQFVTELALKECHLPRVPPKSILVAITGQGKTRGKAAVLGVEATINQHIAFLSIHKPTATPEFLCLYLTGAYSQLRAISDDSGSTKGALTCDDLKHFRVSLPPIEEQVQIVKKVAEESLTIDTAISRTQSEIDLIREYRTRLISDVVTGKLDVRGAVLPDVFPGAGDPAEERLDIDETYAEPDDDAGEGEAGEEITDDADE